MNNKLILDLLRNAYLTILSYLKIRDMNKPKMRFAITVLLVGMFFIDLLDATQQITTSEGTQNISNQVTMPTNTRRRDNLPPIIGVQSQMIIADINQRAKVLDFQLQTSSYNPQPLQPRLTNMANQFNNVIHPIQRPIQAHINDAHNKLNQHTNTVPSLPNLRRTKRNIKISPQDIEHVLNGHDILIPGVGAASDLIFPRPASRSRLGKTLKKRQPASDI